MEHIERLVSMERGACAQIAADHASTLQDWEDKYICGQIAEKIRRRTHASQTHGYCRDCKHWQAPGDLIGKAGSAAEGFGQCGLSEFEANDIGDRLAIGECYDFGAIRCKASFGCVQFEAK